MRKKKICREPRVRFPRCFPPRCRRPATSLSTENNENIDPRENDGALSGHFPGLRDLYRLHHRRRRRHRRRQRL